MICSHMRQFRCALPFRKPNEIIVAMKKLGLTLFLNLLLLSCAAPGQVATNTPQQVAYPPIIEESPTRQQAAAEAWKRFLAEWRLPEVKPDLMPVINTPRALPQELAQRINIFPKPGALNDTEAKEALRAFIDHTRDVLSGTDKNVALGPKELSLATFASDGTFYRAVFRQVNYPFPIAGNYGELHFVLAKNGQLLQWSSSLLPDVSLPARAELKPESIYDKMIGHEFTYTTIAGRPESYKVSKRDEVKIGELVIYPRLAGNRLEIRLAYPVTVGESMTWTVYVDAINGGELGKKQNFAS